MPDYLANQIAAGEVVQRPDSVIKELVENSIDAGATEIAVFVKNAGKQLIHILDNGKGISEEDMPLAVKRHATSKILSQQDLECIRSFGFRGEALASIASVANVEIRSKTKEAELGCKLLSKPNVEPEIEPMKMENGTQIFVRNLFYNVPARRKFLRSNITEFKHISETMTKFAISHNDKRFTFYDDNNLIFDVPPQDLKDRLLALMGTDISGKLLPVEYSNAIIKITGFVGTPELAKKNTGAKYFFLNGRSIISKSLAYAVFLSFENLIDRSFKPFYVLKIELDPHRVDINVHPQKHEVKFDDEALVHNAVKTATMQALQKNSILTDLEILTKKSNSPIEKVYHNEDDSNDFLLVNTGTGEIVGDSEFSNTNPSYGKSKGYSGNYSGGYSNKKEDFWNKGSESKSDFSKEISAYEEVFGNIESQTETPQGTIELADIDKVTEGQVWQFSSDYMLFKFNDNLVLLDILKSRQRILYEKQLKRIKKRQSISQKLLFPIMVQLPISKKVVLDEILDEIEKFGFGVRPVRENFELFELPPEIDESSAANVFESIIDSYHEYKLLRTGDLLDNLAVAIAMQSYYPKNENMSALEMTSLVKELLECSMPNNCPRGRKTMVIMGEKNLREMLR